jgi:hypothetical protein
VAKLCNSVQMITHTVLLEMGPEVSQEDLQYIAELLRQLPNEIEEIRSYEVGLDCGFAPNNAHIAVIARFASAEDYAIYAAHPRHLEVISTHIRPRLAARSAAQFESDGVPPAR